MFGSGATDAAGPAFAIIAAKDSDSAAISRETAAFIFKRRLRYWKSGARIQPANLPANDPLRRAFSLCLLGQTPDAMASYWQEMYFHGVVPPFVIETERAVLLFVERTPGAIGYVSTCPLDPDLRVLLVVGEAPNCPRPTATCATLQD